MGLISVAKEKRDEILNKNYYVECELYSGKIHIFTSILQNVDSKHFWFDNEDGLNVISQDRIVIMTRV